MKRKLWLTLALTVLLLGLCWTAQAQAPASISLSKTEATLGLAKYNNEVNNLTPLVVTVKPAGAELTLKSLKSDHPEVADVVLVEGKPYIQAHKGGTARITAVTNNGKKAGLTVKVKSFVKVSKIKPSASKLTLKVGGAGQFTCSVSPATADAISRDLQQIYRLPVKYESSDESVLLVDDMGFLYGKKAGSATVTLKATDGSGVKAKIKVTVKSVPVESIALNQTAATLTVGSDPLRLAPTFAPANATNQSVTWKSSDEKVAKVDKDGLVTGLKPGKATITCVSKSGDKKAKCAVTVGYGFNETTYRVYAIGNQNYGPDDQLIGTVEDMQRVAKAFENASFGGQKAQVKTYANLTGQQIVNVLDEMIASGADENDVSVFYYSGHGAAGNAQVQRGALCGVDNYTGVTVETVRKKLDQVPGTVVVILDSCLSGQYIQSKGASRAAASTYNQSIVSAFAASNANNYVQSKALTDSPIKGKYKILTAASSMNTSNSFGLIIDGVRVDGGLFTLFLAEGMGYDAVHEAAADLESDADKDGVVTLAEAYSYVDRNVKAFEKNFNLSYQQTQVWPKGDRTAILARN